MLKKWGPEPEPKPERKRRRRLGPAALAAPITAPRWPEAALAAIKAGHPDVNPPRHFLRTIKVAAYAPGCTPSAGARPRDHVGDLANTAGIHFAAEYRLPPLGLALGGAFPHTQKPGKGKDHE
jgi:hypothetical protein